MWKVSRTDSYRTINFVLSHWKVSIPLFPLSPFLSLLPFYEENNKKKNYGIAMNDSVNQEKIYHLSCTDRYRFSHFRGVTGPVSRSTRRNSISSRPLVLVLRDKQAITFENTEKMHRVIQLREALRTSLLPPVFFLFFLFSRVPSGKTTSTPRSGNWWNCFRSTFEKIGGKGNSRKRKRKETIVAKRIRSARM